MDWVDVVIGAIFAAVAAFAAWRAGALSRGGALAAFGVGTLTYASGQIPFTLVLLAFFIPSVVLSRLGRARKRVLVDVGKSGPRDAAQVLANGGAATICALLWALTHDFRWSFAFAGAYAAATADTWGTEIGTLARHAPRSILTLRRIATGLSGGITLPGTLAEIVGAAWIGVAYLAAMVVVPIVRCHGSFGWSASGNLARHPWLILALVPLAGIAGSTLDSVLGGSLQALRRCDACGRTCETDPHACGERTRLVRGLGVVSNDVVNFSATAAGALVAYLLTGP